MLGIDLLANIEFGPNFIQVKAWTSAIWAHFWRRWVPIIPAVQISPVLVQQHNHEMFRLRCTYKSRNSYTSEIDRWNSSIKVCWTLINPSLLNRSVQIERRWEPLTLSESSRTLTIPSLSVKYRSEWSNWCTRIPKCSIYDWHRSEWC